MTVYFSDVFGVDPADLDEYGAFNVSLVCDLPLFIDPFLLFNSDKPVYRDLHARIIEYVKFLKRKAQAGPLPEGLVKAWFTFPEVKQNWLGYTGIGNGGRGLGRHFANALNKNLNSVFRSFGEETVSKGSHLEKLTLIRSGVGRDNVSDFTTNLVKEFLLEYTQDFTRRTIAADRALEIMVRKVRFNYTSESWESRTYTLPFYRGDYVLLTPRDILTKDEAWISHRGLVADFRRVVGSIPNDQLRDQLNNYFDSILSARSDLNKEPAKKEVESAVSATVERFPEVLDFFIKLREERGAEARTASAERVARADRIYVKQLRRLVLEVLEPDGFYRLDSHTEAKQRVEFLKHVIENQGGWRIFYDPAGNVIERESDVQTMFKLVWFKTEMDVSPEANSGRGPVDFKVAMGAFDKTLIEFKLASNRQLKRNLERQVETYEKAESHPAPPKPSLKVIVFMSAEEEDRARQILKEVGLEDDPNVILIDARSDNKPSGSRA